MARVDVDAMDLCRKMTITVQVNRTKEMRIRLWVAINLMKIVAWIGGLGWGGVKDITEEQ